MRGLLATLCAATLSLGSPCARAAAMGPATAESPEQLYEEGRKDYRLGRFKDAIDKWERAYAIAELPLLLYNIALAYRQLYDVSADVEDLRRGKVVLKNFLVVAERDPDVDPEDAKLLMEEIDALIAKAQTEAGPDPADPADDPPDPPDPLPPTGEDPGKKLRLAGAITMGAGGAVVVGGVVLGVVFALKGGNFRDDLRNYQIAETNGDPCMRADGAVTACEDAIASARDNGRKANLYSGLGFGLGGALGLAAIAAGAVLFVQGNRKSAAWSGRTAGLRSSLRMGPSMSPSGLGMTVSGRF
jgi:tetratricopeptide (TPR) repeat protein